MQRIVIRHLSGSKANQVEEFPLNHFNEIILGRDPSATVKYDPERDDLVGRLHAKISPDPSNAEQFAVTDLGSRNGTYVNKQRIVGSAKIAPGDLIQLGPGGPEFQFDLEPRPMITVKDTRSSAVGSFAPSVPSTRQVDLGLPATGSVSLSAPGSTASRTVGKATVERMITQTVTETKKTEGRRYMMIGGMVLLALLIVFGGIAGYLAWQSRSSQTELSKVQKEMASAPMSENEIAALRRGSVVKIEVSWKLLAPSGVPVFQKYANNVRDAKKGKNRLLVPDKSKDSVFPCYIKLKNDGPIEPLLTTENSASTFPIGGQYNGTGFLVNSDGYILTTRFNAYPWENEYPLPEFEWCLLYFEDPLSPPLLTSRDDLIEKYKVPNNWVPAKSKQRVDATEGRYDGVIELQVIFPDNPRRYTGTRTTGSEQQDVALIKVSLPTALPAADSNDNPDSIKQGDRISMLGYPANSVPEFTTRKTRMTENGPSESALEIANPEFYAGSIGKLFRTKESSAGKGGLYSEVGDKYQLNINAPTRGNSGSPIFDDHGRVIAIFSTGQEADSTHTFAVPIRYGKELLTVK